jgi:hypothetical protein
VLQEEFPEGERGLFILAIRTTEYDADQAGECFQSPQPLSALRADLNSTRGRTSAVERFRRSFSATARAGDTPAIPPPSGGTRSAPWPLAHLSSVNASGSFCHVKKVVKMSRPGLQANGSAGARFPLLMSRHSRDFAPVQRFGGSQPCTASPIQ